MPLQATSGAASYDAFGGGVPVVPNYIEDVFSTYLYTGTNANQTITNNIDLSTNGGLVWIKSRVYAQNHGLFDTVRGVEKSVSSNSTAAQLTQTRSLTAFGTSGFSLGTDDIYGNVNFSGVPYASWTFRKQPKFFDVVTYTGNSVVGRQISHNLGSVPGCIIVKKLNSAGSWITYHRSLGATKYLALNTTAAQDTFNGFWNDTTPTSTVFTVGDGGEVNDAGSTYVAYLFAHDAGGFGLTGTDNVISCGSFTTDATTGNATVNLGYEPQWILTKRVSDAGYDWTVYDNMRGMSLTNSYELFPNSTSSETNFGSPDIFPSATGFSVSYVSGSGQYGKNKTIIYIAIRRGPMKVPTVGTSVFSPNLETTSTNPQTLTTGFPVDLSILTVTTGTNRQVSDRLRGGSTSSFTYLLTDSTAAEVTYSGFGLGYDNNTGIVDSSTSNQPNAIFWNFRRAPSFFDEVCYTGTGSATTQTHNLGVAPELIICKRRNGVRNWPVRYSTAASPGYGMYLDDTGGEQNTVAAWTTTAPTSTVFSIGASTDTNGSGDTYVAYLFATCAGVSKVGTYTGNGTTQTINCGFTGGARFVLIKRTDSTGGWYVYDTARGMTVLTDPYLFLNSTAAETATLGSVTTVTTGFALNSTILSAINVSGGSYLFLAIS